MELSGCLVWWVGAALSLVHPTVPPAAAPTASGAGAGAAAAIIHRWDAARAAAWAAGDASALRALYTRGSSAGRADVRLLRRYSARGLEVRGLRTQLFRIQVLNQGPGQLALRLVDRLAGGVAVGAGRCLALPHDHADTRTVTLRREDGEWLVADVR